MSPALLARVRPLLLGGLVTRVSLIRAGLGPDLGQREVAAERWLRLAPGIYLASPGPATHDQLLLAALLHGGDGAVLCGAQAARLHQCRWVPERSVTDLLVEHHRKVAECAGIETHRTRSRIPLTTRGGWPVVGVADAVLQTARWAESLRDARGVVLGAVHDQKVTVLELEEALGRWGPWGRRQAARTVKDAARGAWSPPEAEVVDLLLPAALAGVLPPFYVNPQVWIDDEMLGVVDLWLLGAGCGGEVDSVEQHSGEQLSATLDRHRRFTDHGLDLLHRTPARIRSDPGAYLRTMIAFAAEPREEPAGLRLVPRGPLLGARRP